MPLFSTSPKPQMPQKLQKNAIAAKIQQRRYQMLVHSLLYYELNINLVSDSKWSEWAEELVQLQKQYPEISETVIFSEAFKTFDGSTGFDLPFRDEQIVNIAYRLLRSAKDIDTRDAIELLRGVQVTPAEYAGFYELHPQKSNKSSSVSQRKVVKKVEPSKRKKLF